MHAWKISEKHILLYISDSLSSIYSLIYLFLCFFLSLFLNLQGRISNNDWKHSYSNGIFDGMSCVLRMALMFSLNGINFTIKWKVLMYRLLLPKKRNTLFSTFRAFQNRVTVKFIHIVFNYNLQNTMHQLLPHSKYEYFF